MSLARVHDPLGNVIIRNIGDAGGPRSDWVADELNSLITHVAKAVRNYDTNLTAVGNIGAGTDPLMSSSVTGGTLVVAKDRLQIFAEGTVSAQDGGVGDTRTVAWSYGGNAIDSRVINNTNAICNWRVDVEIYVTDATHAFYTSKWEAWNSGSDTAAIRSFGTQGTMTVTHANTNSIAFTGASSDAVNNDIQQLLLRVDVCNQ